MRPATSAGEERERVENVTFRSPGTNEKEKKFQNAHQLIETAAIFL